MSVWDELQGAWNDVTSGDFSGALSSLGNAFTGGGGDSAAGGALNGSDVMSNGYSGSGAGGFGTALSGAASDYGGTALGALGDYGSSMPSYSNTASFVNNGFGVGTPSTMTPGLDLGGTSVANDYNLPNPDLSSGGAAGTAASGGAGLGSTAIDWAKKNPDLARLGVQAGLALTKNTSPAPATQQGYNAAAAGNATSTAVGNSIINQAPFLANNAEAASKNAGANASSALGLRLQQQGYKPGDAMYDSAMQQQNIGNGTNDATAYAAGAGQSATQQATGAKLTQPTNLTAYDSLGGQQNSQQVAGNTTASDLGAAASKAFDVWANPDKAPKTATSTTTP